MATKTVKQWVKGATDGLQDFSTNVQKELRKIPDVSPPSFGDITKNYDYLIGDEYKFKGTVHAGGISYSGADIKVVVAVYNTQEKQLNKWLNDKDTELNQLDFDVYYYETLEKQSKAKLDNDHFGTQDYNYHRKDYWEFGDKKLQSQERLKDLQDEVRHETAKVRGKPPTAVLAEAQTLTISSYRDKAPVRSLGSVYPKGYTRGPRQIGGSIVFTVFDRDALYDFLDANPSDFDGNRQTSAVLDQLPPVDIIISFASELGSISRMAIYGVEFVNNGQIMSIEDIISENTVEYVARDFDPMQRVGVRDLTQESAGSQINWQSKTGSDLLFEEDYQKTKYKVDPFERFKRRSTRFL